MTIPKKSIQMAAGIMAQDSWNSPVVKQIYKGVRDPETILFQLCHTKAEHFAKLYDFELASPDGRAFLIGRDTLNENKWADIILQIKLFYHSIGLMKLSEIRSVISRRKKSECLLNDSWHKAFISGRCYKIEVIGISKEIKDLSYLLKIIGSRIRYCEKHKIPMVVATPQSSIASLLCGMGFEIVRKTSFAQENCSQFGMILFPEGINRSRC